MKISWEVVKETLTWGLIGTIVLTIFLFFVVMGLYTIYLAWDWLNKSFTNNGLISLGLILLIPITIIVVGIILVLTDPDSHYRRSRRGRSVTISGRDAIPEWQE